MLEIRPSGAYRWEPCTAAPSIEALFPDDRDDHIGGEAAHWLAATIKTYGGDPKTYINYQHENGAFITDEMIETVKIYLNTLPPVGHIEEKIAITRIAPNYEGTPDFWYFDSATVTLHVYDLKYGWGIVEPFESLQLISYAIGIIDEHFRDIEQFIDVQLHIVQPRAWHRYGHTRTWKTRGVDLRPFGNRLNMSYEKASGPEPIAVSGPHCRYCRGLLKCHTGRAAAFNAVDISEAPIINHFGPEIIGIELSILERALEALQWRKDAVEMQALDFVKKGTDVPGWSPTSGQGKLAWIRPVEDVLALGTVYDIDLLKKDVRTPTQAKSAGLPNDVLKHYARRTPGKVSLKPDGVKILQLFSRS